MIHRIYSSLPTFKELEFREGLNILVVDTVPGASDKQTRNRAGKTSLIELVHFLTGADCRADCLFRKDALQEHMFGISFDLHSAVIHAERTAQDANTIATQGDTRKWPVAPSIDKATQCASVTNTVWRSILGNLVFSLPLKHEKFAPSFRSMFPYFVRRERDGGFDFPAQHNREQQTGDQQVSISYLLGLDWTVSQQWQEIREREKTLSALRKAIRQGAFGPGIESAAELRSKLAVAEEQSGRLRNNLRDFRVLPQYHDLEVEASQLTVELGQLADANTLDLGLVQELQQSMASEAAPSLQDFFLLYEEIGVTLPDTVLRRFEGVRQFHQSVIDNRRTYLSGEIQAAEGRLSSRREKMGRLDLRRSQIMLTLEAHQALDQFAKWQTELTRLESSTEAIRQRLIAAEQLEGRKSELEIERHRLFLRLLQDLQEQNHVVSRAVLAFEAISAALYLKEQSGYFRIREDLNGPQFDVHIHGEDSSGVNSMQVFCFDMMIMQICAERQIGPGFLIHDSHLFDPVDKRQVAEALRIGARMAKDIGFQYIVTMNSDWLSPNRCIGNFDISDYELPVRLTDATETGGLFGFRFD